MYEELFTSRLSRRLPAARRASYRSMPIACHTPLVTRRPFPARRPSPITYHLSPVTLRPSPVIRHPSSPITRHLPCRLQYQHELCISHTHILIRW